MKFRLSAWKLRSFQEEKVPGLKSSSLSNISPGKTSSSFPKIPLMHLWHLLLVLEQPWEHVPGGQEMPSPVAWSHEVARLCHDLGLRHQPSPSPDRGQTCSLLGWRWGFLGDWCEAALLRALAGGLLHSLDMPLPTCSCGSWPCSWGELGRVRGSSGMGAALLPAYPTSAGVRTGLAWCVIGELSAWRWAVQGISEGSNGGASLGEDPNGC